MPFKNLPKSPFTSNYQSQTHPNNRTIPIAQATAPTVAHPRRPQIPLVPRFVPDIQRDWR